jgi:hypothetical protein
VPELTLVVEEEASLRIKEGDACRHANEIEKFAALAERRARLDATETERIRKERDELLQTVAGLRTECDSARQERVDAYQRIDRLLGELEKERELKIEAADVAASLAGEVAQQQEEAHKLREQVNGETPVFLVAFLSEPGVWPSNVANERLGQVSMTDSR